MTRRRVPQPPVRPLLRDPERHDFWPGLVVAVVGLLMLYSGARHLTVVETQEGGSAREVELVKAFARGGLQFRELPTSVELPLPAGRASAATSGTAARVADLPLRDRYRVNTGAVDPCPT